MEAEFGGTIEKKKGHVLMIPLSSQTHIAPSFKLAKAIAERGVTVTFVGQRRDILKLESTSKSDELHGLDFHFVALEDFLGTMDNVTVTPVTMSEDLKFAFKPIAETLVADRKAGKSGPTCIVADNFIVWAQVIALQLEIPIYPFFTNGAAYARLWQAIPGLVSDNAFPVVEGKVGRFDGCLEIPGVPKLQYDDLPASVRVPPVSCVTAMGKFFLEADGLLINTFYELDSVPIEALLSGSPTKIPSIFPIGPLSTASTSFSPGLEDPGNLHLEWLSTLPPMSALYICLGSMVRLSPQQIYQLALALEASQQNFLWVLPKGKDNFSTLEEVLPEGFELRMKDKGRIATGWVPQLQILGHASVGGFLSHCGWASCLESITKGVPLLAWPHGAEQHLNARYLVDILGLALELPNRRRRGSDKLVTHEDFESGIRGLMVGEEGKVVTARVQKMKLKAEEATRVGGSSSKAIGSFVSHIRM